MIPSYWLEPDLLIPLLVLTGGLGAALVYFFCATKTPEKRMKALGERLALAWDSRRWALNGRWKEHLISIDYDVGGDAESDALVLGIQQPLRANLPETTFSKEGALHRLAKLSGLSREAQSGDPLFDESVYVESGDDAKIGLLLSDASLREHILSLLEIRGASLTVNADGLALRIPEQRDWSRYFEPAEMEMLLGRMAAVLAPLKGSRQSEPPPPPESASLRPVLAQDVYLSIALIPNPFLKAWVAASAVSMLLGFGLFYWGGRYPPIDSSLNRLGLRMAASLFAAYGAALFFSLRGKSGSHRALGSYLLFALIGYPMFFVGLLTTLNGIGTAHDAFSAVAVVESKRLRQDQRSMELLIYHPSGTGRRWVPVSATVYDNVQPATKLVLRLAPGRLGTPWLVELPQP